MLTCDVKGCTEIESEILGSKEILACWIVLRACQCGAWDGRNKQACKCFAEGPVPTSFWPNLDWFAFGGVDKITLCPLHRPEVTAEIIRQRGLDPSMNSVLQNFGNKH